MSQADDEFLDKLEAIRRSYMEGAFPQQIRDVNDAVASFVHPAEDGGSSLEAVHAVAHKLAGSSGTFGMMDLSVLARALSELTDTRQSSVSKVGEDIGIKITAMLDELNSIAARVSPDPDDRDCEGDETALQLANTGDGAAEDESSDQTVIFFGTGSHDDDRLDELLSNNGYGVVRIDGVESLGEVIARRGTVVVVADLISYEAVAEAFERVFRTEKNARDSSISLVFLSTRHSLDARLSAVRAGGDAFLTIPLDPYDLIDSVDRVTDRGVTQPYRVLVIDDDADFVSYIETALRESGFICEHVEDPVNTLEVLESFSPEIILLDLNMPGVDGRELAIVIRHQEAFVGTPIVFLSAESKTETKVDAMGLGGDDFLTKPIELDHLVGVLKSRTERFRLLRSRMVQDSLTGLINHSTTKQLLDREVERSRRMGAPLTFAMLDIDHFKNVNDTYGHGIGDRVIRAVARLLKSRLRSIDVIGRMGGEEFGVVLSGTAGSEALDIFNQIREAFSDIEFRIDGGHFECTFSCGVAEFPDCPTSMEILDCADKALYKAKHGGRNRVELYRA